jgi:hypothetical protein
MAMSKVELVCQALLELGDAPAPEIASFIEQRHGVRIEARIIPVLRAAVRGQEVVAKAHQAARAVALARENPASGQQVDGAARAVMAPSP